jgi:hypothetical protein
MVPTRTPQVQNTVRFNEKESKRIDHAVYRSGLSAQRYLAIAILTAVTQDEEYEKQAKEGERDGIRGPQSSDRE